MEKKIIDYIQEVALEKGITVDNNTDLFASGVFDSMEVIVFLTYLDEELGIKFKFDDLKFENFQFIKSIIEWITKDK